MDRPVGGESTSEMVLDREFEEQGGIGKVLQNHSKVCWVKFIAD
jgi:hypothetical protein